MKIRSLSKIMNISYGSADGDKNALFIGFFCIKAFSGITCIVNFVKTTYSCMNSAGFKATEVQYPIFDVQ